jgi:predicted glycogen debranching enzyme
MKLSVWPSVDTHGELDSAGAEWLHTNGAGAYAMSTVALMHTRRFHGLFVAALEPPLERHVVVSHAETVLEVGRRVYRLSTHQFPDVAPTPGYRLLESFAQDPLPRWVFRIEKHRMVRRLCLARGQNMLIVSYTWYGRTPVKLTVKPLLPMRPIHDLRSEHGGFIQKVNLKPGRVTIQPVRSLPPIVFGHNGLFMGSPDWWRRFEYSEDMRREVHYQEDLWTPGTFELTLNPREPTYLTASLNDLPTRSAEELMQETESELRALDPGTDHSMAVRALTIGAEQFRATLAANPATIAGYPWLGARCRDTLVSLPGLYLATGLIEDAKKVLRQLVKQRADGLLLDFAQESFLPPAGPSIDASLWLFETADLLAKKVNPDDEFIATELYPVLVEIFSRVQRHPGHLVWVTDEGLLATGGTSEPLTWMDSKARGAAVTPRAGLAIELQALWAKACRVIAGLAASSGNVLLAQQAGDARLRAVAAFRRYFWCENTGFPYDVVDERSKVGDPAIRPNAVIALAIDPELFDGWQATAIVERAKELLLTPRGLRTLEPNHPAYVGYYEGGMEDRRAAYHQGVVWGYLVGFLARAWLRIQPNNFELQVDIRDWLLRVAENGPVLGQIAQVASGDEPHGGGGCPAQAWNAAELLRSLKEDLGL